MATKKKIEKIGLVESMQQLLERDGKVSRFGECVLGMRKVKPMFDWDSMTEKEKQHLWKLAMR